jgi:4-amino-4-deoxy-L-arabinose transferase-like glycosyltransferase
MDEFRFFSFHYLAVALVGLLSYLYGRYLTRHIDYNSWFEQLSFSITLGLGFLAYLVLFLGLLGLLYRSVLTVVLIAASLVCYPIWMRWPKTIASAWTGLKRGRIQRWWSVIAVASVGLVAALPILLLPLYPPTQWDAISYHLVVAKTYANEHAIAFTPYLAFPTFPQTNQMLFTIALLFHDDILVQLIQLLIMLTLGMALIGFGRRFFSVRVGWLAAAILIASPLVVWLGTVAYVDIGLMLFTTIATYAFGTWLQTREHRWLVLAAIFCGLAVGTKYPAIVFLILLQLAAVVSSFKERKYYQPFVFGFVATLVAAPWLARNIYYTGNPVFPFFNRMFGQLIGYRLWKKEYLTGLYEDFSFAGFTGPGIGKSFESLVTLPWHLAFHQGRFMAEAPLSPIYLFVLPLIVIVAIKSKRIAGLVAMAGCFTLLWFVSIQLVRYLMPALPLFCLAASASVDRVLVRAGIFENRTVHKLALAVVCMACFSQSWLFAIEKMRLQGPIPVTTTERESYLSQRIQSYPVCKRLNEIHGRNYRLYSIFEGRIAYFLDGTYMGMQYGPASYDRIGAQLIGERGLSLRGLSIPDGELLYTHLVQLGADYLLINRRLELKLPKDEFFSSHFSLVYEAGPISLFELVK